MAYEATATYHRALEIALADWPCVKLNPERARRFAQATGALANTDRIDAMLLARMAATLQPAIRPARSMQQAQMAELINARDGLVRDRTALKNREKNLTIALLKRQCRQRPEQIDRHIEALDAEIASLVAADATLARRHQILTSIAGVGTLTANQLIATMPELGSLENKQAVALAGLAPVVRQSGQWKGKSFIRGGRAVMQLDGRRGLGIAHAGSICRSNRVRSAASARMVSRKWRWDSSNGRLSGSGCAPVRTKTSRRSRSMISRCP
ncbi:transposase [Blastomonas natatoria]|uniref:Transposase n=1 Tax=Blastomonas natatoria TaxID=34015 RepID=A0A2V3UR87_9SPHN|nr:transposase [Blastomonas natatoria]